MAIYYVDKSTGSDSDTGLTEELAWETINKVNISSFSPNDQILFKKGETWREQLAPPDSGSDGSPITFGSYGSGADPIINGADIISGWTDYGCGTITLSIYNNTLYMNAGTGQNEFKLSDIVAVLNLKNNIIFTTPTRRTIQFNDVQTGSVAIDYNLQWRADGVPNMIVSGSTKTWEQWQGLGYDTNGVNEDPLFTNPGSNNFTLTGTSPCRDAGTDVSLTQDYLGRTVPQGSAQDIGAHEFVPPTAGIFFSRGGWG